MTKMPSRFSKLNSNESTESIKFVENYLRIVLKMKITKNDLLQILAIPFGKT